MDIDNASHLRSDTNVRAAYFVINSQLATSLHRGTEPAHLKHCKAGSGYLAILGARASAYTDAPHELAVDHDRQTALDGSGARQLHDDGAAAAHGVLQRFGRTFKPHRGCGLFRRHHHAADL